jgi:hypothetical protein
MPAVMDCSSVTTTRLTCLKNAGVKTIIRYYARDTGNPAKVVKRAEAQAIAAAGLRLGVVQESRNGDKPSGFSKDIGFADARHSRTYAHNEIGQPEGSAIYFGVDFDTSANQVNSLIIPYFRGVAEAFAEANGLPTYQVGAYGSGRTLRALLGAGLTEFAWLAQSTGWAGHAVFLASGDWALNQRASTTLCMIGIDPDDINPARPEFGDFVPGAAVSGGGSIAGGHVMIVNATGGLRMRAGPGTAFDVIRLLPFGTRVTTGSASGDWVMVDLDGDGGSDGFVHAAFLRAP